MFRGCALISGLATFYPARFAGFAFLAVGYLAPTPDYNFEAFIAGANALVGYECFGYFQCVLSDLGLYVSYQTGSFYAEEGADKIIADHVRRIRLKSSDSLPG